MTALLLVGLLLGAIAVFTWALRTSTPDPHNSLSTLDEWDRHRLSQRPAGYVEPSNVTPLLTRKDGTP